MATSTLGGPMAVAMPSSPLVKAHVTLSSGRTLATLSVERAGTLALAGKSPRIIDLPESKYSDDAHSTINYGGSFNPQGNGYLAVYGWTRSPLVEYYVIESFGTYDPSSGAQYKGSFSTDGGNYNVYVSTRTVSKARVQIVQINSHQMAS